MLQGAAGEAVRHYGVHLMRCGDKVFYRPQMQEIAECRTRNPPTQSLVAGLLALAHTRLELFSVELQSNMEKHAGALTGRLAAVTLVSRGVAARS